MQRDVSAFGLLQRWKNKKLKKLKILVGLEIDENLY